MVHFEFSFGTTSQSSRTAFFLSRLRHDIFELQSLPYPGVELHTFDESHHEVCVILTPQSGALCGLRLHLDMQLPEDWPTSPPTGRLSYPQGIDHPYCARDGSICSWLQIPNSGQSHYSRYDYTPAYTLKCFCIQLLSIFTMGDTYHGHNLSNEWIDGAFVTSYIPLAPTSNEDLIAFEAITSSQWRSPHSVSPENHLKAGSKILSRSLNFVSGTAQVQYNATQAQYNAGSWSGWNVGHMAPQEVEITKYVDIFGQVASSIKLQLRNPRWTNSYNLMRGYSCERCNYNLDGTSLVDASLLKTLKQAVAELDKTAIQQLSSSSPWSNVRSVTVPSTNTSNKGGISCIGNTRSCFLGILNYDVLLCIADQLPDGGVYAFGNAYPRFRLVVEQSRIMLLRMQPLQCFYSKASINARSTYQNFGKTILGFGICVSPKSNALYSSLDMLSLEVYDMHKVERSVDLSIINAFIPLALSQAHFERAEPEIWKRLAMIVNAPQLEEGRFLPEYIGPTIDARGSPLEVPKQDPAEPLEMESIEIIYKLMSDVITRLMTSPQDVLKSMPIPCGLCGGEPCGGLYEHGLRPSSLEYSTFLNGKRSPPNEKSVVGYCQLFHLLVKLATTSPEIRAKAYNDISHFKSSEAARRLSNTPDLGILFVKICLVAVTQDPNHVNEAFHKSFSWVNDLCGPIIEEVLTRNVKILLKDQPELSIEDPPDDSWYRRRTVLTSRAGVPVRSLMFHTYFLRFVVSNIRKYPHFLNDHYQFPPVDVAQAIVREIKEIHTVEKWSEVFNKVGYLNGLKWSKTRLTAMLRGRINEAKSRGSDYYEAPILELPELRRLRKSKDPGYDLEYRR